MCSPLPAPGRVGSGRVPVAGWHTLWSLGGLGGWYRGRGKPGVGIGSASRRSPEVGRRMGRSLDGFTALSWGASGWSRGPHVSGSLGLAATHLGLPLVPREFPALITGISLTPVLGSSARLLSLLLSTTALHARLPWSKSECLIPLRPASAFYSQG